MCTSIHVVINIDDILNIIREIKQKNFLHALYWGLDLSCKRVNERERSCGKPPRQET